jgi:hypothetical protein
MRTHQVGLAPTIRALVKIGLLEARGDISDIQRSELRLPHQGD